MASTQKPGKGLDIAVRHPLLRVREVISLASQTVTRVAGIAISLILTGMAAKHLPPATMAVMLSLAAFLSVPGLLQLGLGNFVLQEVAHSYARGNSFADLHEARGAYVLVLSISLTASLAAAIAALYGHVPSVAVPLAIVAINAQWAMIADFVRTARGHVLGANAIQLSALALMALAMWISLRGQPPISWLAVIATYGAPFVASGLSFALLLRDVEFRRLVSLTRPLVLIAPIRNAAPFYASNVAFAVMMALPVLASAISAREPLSLASMACLRLWATAVFTFYFVLQPLTSVIARYRYVPAGSPAVASIVKLVALAVCVGAVGAGIYAAAAPKLIHIWLNGVEVSYQLAGQWALILLATTTIMTGVFVAQILGGPALSFIVLASVDVSCVVLLGLAARSTEWAMTIALAIGAALTGGAFYVLMRRIYAAREVEAAAERYPESENHQAPAGQTRPHPIPEGRG